MARDYLDAEAVANVPTGTSRLETARALLALGVVFRAGWSKVNGRTGVTAESSPHFSRHSTEKISRVT